MKESIKHTLVVDPITGEALVWIEKDGTIGVCDKNKLSDTAIGFFNYISANVHMDRQNFYSMEKHTLLCEALAFITRIIDSKRLALGLTTQANALKKRLERTV